MSSSLLLSFWACTEGPITLAPWTPRRLPHRLGTGECAAGAQRRELCCDQRPILTLPGHRTHLNWYCYITAALSLGGCGRRCALHPQWLGFVASVVPAIGKNAPHAIGAITMMVRRVLHRCDPRLSVQLVHLSPGLLIKVELLNRRDQPIAFIMIGCGHHTRLATDPWREARPNVLAHHRHPCVLPCRLAQFQVRHLRAPPPPFPQFSWEPWQQHARPANAMGCSCCRPSEPCGPPRGSFQASNLVAAALDADALRAGAPRPCNRPPSPPPPRSTLALSVQLTAAWGHLLVWGLGLQAGRPISDQWSTLARLVISHHSQRLMLAVLRAEKARARARARPLRVAKTDFGAARAGVVLAPSQQQAWLLILHHAHLSLPCRLGSSKFSLARHPSLHQFH